MLYPHSQAIYLIMSGHQVRFLPNQVYSFHPASPYLPSVLSVCPFSSPLMDTPADIFAIMHSLKFYFLYVTIRRGQSFANILAPTGHAHHPSAGSDYLSIHCFRTGMENDTVLVDGIQSANGKSGLKFFRIPCRKPAPRRPLPPSSIPPQPDPAGLPRRPGQSPADPSRATAGRPLLPGRRSGN